MNTSDRPSKYSFKSAAGVHAALVLLALGQICAANATTYSGNGDTSFGGAIGTGSLTLSDDGTTISGSISRGSGNFNDALVLFIELGPGGFSSTSGFSDANDGLRKAISGFDGGGNRSVLTFTGGFAPNYAIALGPNNQNFGGLWQLANGGNNSLPFVSSVSLSPLGTATASTYTFSFSAASIGLTPMSGQSFELFGTYVSDTGDRSAEAIAGNDSGSAGYNPFTETTSTVYTIAPEPSSLALFGVGGSLWLIRRRKG